MKLKQYIPVAAACLALVLTACSDDTKNVNNGIFAPTSETASTINVKPTTSEAVGYVEARLAKKTDRDVMVSFAADAAKVAVYNALYGTEAEMLPQGHYSLPKPQAVIPAGGNTTGQVEVRFENLTSLDLKKMYVLPVVMSSEYGSLSNDTYYFVIKEASLISVTADMTENYAVFAQGGQAPQLEGMTEITVEALVYPHDFPNMLATIMGIEGQFLVRVGDAGLPPNQIQLATSAGNVTDPAWALETGKWTFVTLTYNTATGECAVYFNGIRKGSVQTGGYRSAVNWNTASGDITDGPRGFYVGYAYDANRWFNGYMSELRVWRRVLTADEINAPYHFYSVAPDSDGLAAYWKMDEGAGTLLHDSANGYDLKCLKAPEWIPVELPAK